GGIIPEGAGGFSVQGAKREGGDLLGNRQTFGGVVGHGDFRAGCAPIGRGLGIEPALGAGRGRRGGVWFGSQDGGSRLGSVIKGAGQMGQAERKQKKKVFHGIRF